MARIAQRTLAKREAGYASEIRRLFVEEILKRFPEWHVDTGAARLSPTSTVRGWEALPAVIP